MLFFHTSFYSFGFYFKHKVCLIGIFDVTQVLLYSMYNIIFF